MSDEIPTAPSDWAPAEVQQLYWERVLSREGLHPEPLPKQMRGPRGTKHRASWARREIAMGTEGGGYVEDGMAPQWNKGIRPHDSVNTETEALMRAKPFEEPKTSIEEMNALGNVLAWAVDQLSEEDQDIWNAHAIEGVGMREIGKRLGVSHYPVSQRIPEIRMQLQALLLDHPEVLEHLGEPF